MIVPGNTIKLVDIGASNAVVPEAQSQSPVAKAVKNIKKKNAGAYIRLEPTSSQTDKTNTQKESGNATSGRGVVYLSHIPDGFYEDEMRQYFSQFGRVTRVKLARSSKTGRSRGYAFIEFQYAEVAKVVAETMNNYLLYNRLLKATYMDKQYPAAFWNQQSCGPQNCPLARNRKTEIKRKNAMLNPAKELAQQSKRRRQLEKTLTRLKDAGVDYTLQVKDEVELPAGAEKKAKKIGSPKNIKQEIQTSEEIVKEDEQTRNTQPVLLVDESDDEIEFNVPSFVIRKTLKRRGSSPLVQQSPKAKKGKQVKSEPQTPTVKSSSRENLSSPENLNEEASSGSKYETRKSGRVSVIPKHISSGFQVTLTPTKSKQKKSLGKNVVSQSTVKCEESSEQPSTPETDSTASSRLQKSVESSTSKKSKNANLSTEKNIDRSPGNIETSPKVRRKSTKTAEISDSVVPSPVAGSVVRKVSPKVGRTGLTPKQVKSNTHIIDKRKTPKSAPIQDSDVKKTPAASARKTVLPKSIGKTPIPKATPTQRGQVQKPNSGDRKAKIQKTPLKIAVGRKSFPLSKPVSEDKRRTGAKTPLKTPVGRNSQSWTGARSPKLSPVPRSSSLSKQSNSVDKKRMGLKTPLKTPVGRKSQNLTAASSPKHSPLSHSTALKHRNSASPKALKLARKSLKLNN